MISFRITIRSRNENEESFWVWNSVPIVLLSSHACYDTQLTTALFPEFQRRILFSLYLFHDGTELQCSTKSTWNILASTASHTWKTVPFSNSRFTRSVSTRAAAHPLNLRARNITTNRESDSGKKRFFSSLRNGMSFLRHLQVFVRRK